MQIQGTGKILYLSPQNRRINYFCAGFSGAGAGAGASAAFSGAGVAGAVASGFGASGFACSAGLQPIVNATRNINENTMAKSFFIKFSPPSNNTCLIS
jgi:hypothetical protein